MKSFSRIFAMSAPASVQEPMRRSRVFPLHRVDQDDLRGDVRGSKGSSATVNCGSLSKQMNRREHLTRRFGARERARASISMGGSDSRQRVIVKIHYFGHAGGGGGALRAHTQYIARDGATREATFPERDERSDARQRSRAHTDYLDRQGADPRAVFYDSAGHDIDGASRTEAWAQSDLRHFRVVLAAEKGAEIGDLPSFTREVMARAETALGTRLSWIAVDHWDTDNPHTHIILRGRRANGQDLVLPREFVKTGFRDIARDVATDWLGRRTPADDRRALDRETRRHGPTRFDRWIEAQLDAHASVRVADLTSPSGRTDETTALKARAKELERLGLAQFQRPGTLQFDKDWRKTLERLELHLDIRKNVIRERTRRIAQERALRSPLPPRR